MATMGAELSVMVVCGPKRGRPGFHGKRSASAPFVVHGERSPLCRSLSQNPCMTGAHPPFLVGALTLHRKWLSLLQLNNYLLNTNFCAPGAPRPVEGTLFSRPPLRASRHCQRRGIVSESLGLTSHKSSCNCTGCGMLRAGVCINCAEKMRR
jgi:hypothetical protein